MSELAINISQAIQNICGDNQSALHEPRFGGNEWKYTKECLDSTYVSSVGKYVDQFEASLAEFTGSRYAIAVSNGTSALHMAMLLAGVKSDDEILMPAFTFVATANAACYCGAIPHFVDIDEKTLGIDPIKLRKWLFESTDFHEGVCINRNTGRIIRAIVPMHTYGHPSDMNELKKVAKEFNMIIVEDAAESLGSLYKGKHTGTIGLLGVLSFNGNKTITTGGGGAILTDSKSLAKKAKHLTTTAKLPHKWEFEHDEVGYNYRMPNINAALGCAQLEQLPSILELKRELFNRYNKVFVDIPNITLFKEQDDCKSNYWLNTLVLDKSVEEHRDSILELTNKLGFMTRPAWKLMSNLKQFKNSPRSSLSVSESLERRIINIPSSWWL